MALTQTSTNGIKDATIATADIADDAVTADKLANAINTDIAAKAVLTGSTNNTITTVTGANAIQGEANLTFDGTHLNLGNTGSNWVGPLNVGTGTSSAAQVIDIYSNSDTYGGLWFSDGTSGADRYVGAIQYHHDSNYMKFDTGGLERLRIDSNGNARLGPGGNNTNSTNYTTLTISNTAGGVVEFLDSGNNNIAGDIIGAEGSGMYISSKQDTPIIFRTGASNSEKLRIDSSGRVLIGLNGNHANASIDDLQVGNPNSATQRGITIGSGDECAIAFSDASDARAGSITYNHGADAMIFKTAGQNERLRINSSGTVFIGTTTSHAGKFIVKDTDNSGNQIWVIGRANDNTGSISFRNNGDAAYTGRIQAGDTNGMEFNVAGSTRASLDTSGNFIINDGNLKILTAGHGIDFSANSHATGMSSELLDSYEEGTWTPSFQSEQGQTPTHTNQTGNYTKVGNWVFIQFYCAWSACLNMGSQARIGGLPYTSGNYGSGSCFTNNWDFNAEVVDIVLHHSGSNFIYLYYTRDNGSWHTLQTDSAAGIIGTMCYKVS